MGVKAKFLMAIANVTRALLGGSKLLKSMAASQPSVVSLAKKLANRLFVLPNLGDTLETWHEGRLACYNATLSLAAKRAADKMKDDIQVSLVSALKRSANNPSQTSGKSKPPLQLELRDWPMSGCPLARALLEFLLQRRSELGNLGRPSLRECPPHCLKPSTLRQLLERLDAFEVLEETGKGTVVRLRWEAVGTKPKASTVPPATSSTSQPYKSSGVKAASGKAGEAKARAGASPGTLAGSSVGADADNPNAAKAAADAANGTLDFNDVRSLTRVIRRGVRMDEEWRQAWTQFCWKRNISSRLSSKDPTGIPKEAVTAFVEQQMPKLKAAEWAEPFFEKAGNGDETLDAAGRGAAARAAAAAGRGAAVASAAGTRGQSLSAKLGQQRRHISSSRSSSGSESDRSRGRRKKRRKEKKAAGNATGNLLGYGDLFSRSSKSKLSMTPEVMMMRAQMMGVSMVMNSPLAMMGMQNPLMNPLISRTQGDGTTRPWQQQSSSTPPPPPPPPPPPAPAITNGPAASAPKPAAPLPPQAQAGLAKQKGAPGKQKDPTIDMDDL
eukprot:TRINITY_DN23149_c0_g1_i2.p1 TRINITY_DN23149_c0_g1~~TRINITY_DN23149_c0_g1_i2.p1  ORF type:complete len:619 (+),score=123.15 TRINITY_DN23149_c0_g1_i2:194-1858(+)